MKAEELASQLDNYTTSNKRVLVNWSNEAAAELRRQSSEIERLEARIKVLEAQAGHQSKDAEKFHEVMRCFRDMQLPHGTCMPRSRMACTNCNATDAFRKLIAEYRGPRVVAQASNAQPSQEDPRHLWDGSPVPNYTITREQ